MIKDAENKSASTQSRRCITVSVDNTNVPRDASRIAYCARWWSKAHNTDPPVSERLRDDAQSWRACNSLRPAPRQ